MVVLRALARVIPGEWARTIDLGDHTGRMCFNLKRLQLDGLVERLDSGKRHMSNKYRITAAGLEVVGEVQRDVVPKKRNYIGLDRRMAKFLADPPKPDLAIAMEIEAQIGERVAPVPGYPGHLASENGRIFSRRRWGAVPGSIRGTAMSNSWRETSQRPDKDGYPRVGVSGIHVHTLVLLAFVGEPGPNQEARHLDGDNTNSVLGNLQWGTPAENAEDKRRHGTLLFGERHGKSKLTEAKVRTIRQLRAQGLSNADIAKKFDVNATTVSSVALRKIWGHVQ